MLRYFYIIICIQFCFCTVSIDKQEHETLERRVRNKSTRLHKKQTKSHKQSQLVQFDVQNFMRRYENDAVDENGLYDNRNRKRDNRHVLTNYGDYSSVIESNKNSRDKNKMIDYPNINDQMSRLNTRSVPDKDLNSRHFNFHSLTFDDKNDLKSPQHDHEKPTSHLPTKLLPDREITSDMKKKCSFKHMKMPFFSYNKLTTKAKRQKKRKLFCFNCHKKSSTPAYMVNRFDDPSDSKSDDENIDHSSDKLVRRTNKVSKRAYDELCPKCIRELFNSLKRKTTKKMQHGTNTYSYKESKTTAKEKTTNPKIDNLNDNLQSNYYYLTNERKKRSDADEIESERERRLKELEEVERKIENVHITAPTFTRVPFNIRNK